MKKILLLLATMCMALSASAVNTDFQETVNGVTSNKIIVVGCTAAVGRVYNSGTGVTDRGFCWSTSPNPTVNDNKTNTYWGDDSWDGTTPNGSTTISSSAGTIYIMRTLQPSTRYYIRPYIKKNGTYSYGKEQRVWTQPQGNTQVTWNKWNASDDQDATGISICQAAEDWFNEWCSFPGYYPTVNYADWEDGAHGSYGGWITMGAGFTWNVGTIMHEMGHGIGVGQDWYYTSWDSPLHPTYLWTGERANRVFTLFQDRPDVQDENGNYTYGGNNTISDGDRVHVCYGLTGNINTIYQLRQAAYYEGLYQDGLPCVSNDNSRGAGPYFSFETEAYLNGNTETNVNTKYYITNEKVASCNRFLVEENGEMKYKEITSRSAMFSNDAYAWYIIYNPTNALYYIKNASTGHYFTYEYATGFGLTTGTTVDRTRWQERMHLMPSRNNTTINGKTLKAYWIHPGNRDRDPDALTASMINQGVAATVGRNFYDDGDIQRWFMLTQDEVNNVGDVTEGFNNPGLEQITELPAADDYSKYFFVFADTKRDLTMMQWDANQNGGDNDVSGNHKKAAFYRARIDLRNDKWALWTMDATTWDGNGSTQQILANAYNPNMQMMTEWGNPWFFHTSDNNQWWSRAKLNYLPDGYWTIENMPSGGGNYLGPWNDGNFGDWQEMAFNKSGDTKVGRFYIYKLLRGQHVKEYQDYSGATPGNPFDITYVLENPGAERSTWDEGNGNYIKCIGWKTDGATWSESHNDALNGRQGRFYFEIGTTSASTLYQDIYGLPAGYYRFSAIATGNGKENNLALIANGHTNEQAIVPATNDGNRTYVIVQLAEGETLRVGAKALGNDGEWVKFDDAQLEYIGTNVSNYNVGAPVTTLENGNYFESLTSFDFDFIDAVTTDNSVAFSILNSSAKVTIKRAGTTVKEGAISLVGTKLTADLSGFEPELNSTYTITLPAGTVGYAGHLSNTALTLTLYTPAIKSDYYYLRNNSTKTYLSRGGGGSQAYMDEFGLAVYLSTDKNGNTTFQYFDSRQWLYGDGWTWTDQGDINNALKFTIEPQGNGVYKFRNKATINNSTSNYLAIYDGKAVCDGRPGDNLVGTTNQWLLESIADHRDNYTRNADAQAAALGITGVSTWAQLETQMTNNYSGTEVYTDIDEVVDHWQWGAHNAYEHQLTNLPNGIYRITVNALQRATQWDWMWAIDPTYGLRDVRYIYGNDQKTQIISNTEDGATYGDTGGMRQYNGLYYPDNTASAERAFAAGKYKNTVYVKVTNGTLNIGIVDPCGIPANNQWLVYKNLKVERMQSGMMELQADIENGAFVSEDLNTITISPTGTVTSATLASGTKVTLYKNGTQLSQITPTVSGANLVVTLPTLEAGATYKLTLAEKTVTYNTGTKNGAFEVTFTVPYFADGSTYYLYNVSEGKYMSRGKAYGTQAIVDDWGLAIKIENKNGKTLLKYFDGNQYLYWADWISSCFADGNEQGAVQFTINKVGDNYQFLNGEQYLAVVDGHIVVNAEASSTTNVWRVESTADHVANYTQCADAQAAAAATAASITGVTTFAAMETLMDQSYSGNIIPITGGKASRYQWYASGDNPTNESEYYKETVTGLEDGLYRLTVNAFQRAAWYEDVFAADNARGSIYLYANDAKTQIKSVAEYGSTTSYTANDDFENANLYYPNNDDGAYSALGTGNYRNVVYVYVSNGTLTFGINNPNKLGQYDEWRGTWAVFQDFQLERMELGQSMSFQADITNGSIVENLTSITLSPAGDATSVTLASGTKLTLYKNDVQVRQITPRVSGANLIIDLPTLDAGATYKLTLDENTATFNNGYKNFAFELTFKTPLIPTGTYYLYNKETGKYLTKSGNEAWVTNEGTTITWTNTNEGATIKFNIDGETNTYIGGRWWSESNYNENDARKWEPIPYDDGELTGYQIMMTQPWDNWKYLYINGERVANNGLLGDNFQSWAYGVWEFRPAVGDVNKDNEVDFGDVTAIARILTGHHTDANNVSYNEEAADMDNDGHVTLKDLTMLVNQLLQ